MHGCMGAWMHGRMNDRQECSTERYVTNPRPATRDPQPAPRTDPLHPLPPTCRKNHPPALPGRLSCPAPPCPAQVPPLRRHIGAHVHTPHPTPYTPAARSSSRPQAA
eukprot:125576-Chlamydomonas_euryale.AAC.3